MAAQEDALDQRYQRSHPQSHFSRLIAPRGARNSGAGQVEAPAMEPCWVTHRWREGQVMMTVLTPVPLSLVLPLLLGPELAWGV